MKHKHELERERSPGAIQGSFIRIYFPLAREKKKHVEFEITVIILMIGVYFVMFTT